MAWFLPVMILVLQKRSDGRIVPPDDSHFRRGAVDGEIIEPALETAGDHVCDHARGQKAEGDAIAAIAVSGMQPAMSGHAADQGKAISSLSEGAGPSEIGCCV